MQILPNTNSSDQVDILALYTSKAYGAGDAGQGFADVLSALGQHTTPDMTSQPRALPEPMRNQAEYAASHAASHGASHAAPAAQSQKPEPIKVTKEDFAALEEDLQQAGMSQEDIGGLREQVHSEEGLTWRSMMQQVNQKLDKTSGAAKPAKQELTNEEQRDLQGFFQKLGFTPDEAKGLLSQFAHGQDDKAWKRIHAKLEAMGDGKAVTIHKSELDALTKAAGLDSSLSASFAGLFNVKGEAVMGRNGLMAIAATLRQSAAAAKGELASDQTDFARNMLNDKLRAALNSALDSANRDKHASNKETKDVQAQKINIKEAAARNHRQSGEVTVANSKGETPDPETAKAAIAKAGEKAEADGEKSASEKLVSSIKENADAKAKDAVQEKPEGKHAAPGKDAKQDFLGQNGQNSQQQAKQTAWQELWGKVGVDESAMSGAGKTTAQADPVLAAAKAQEAMQAAQQQMKAAKGDAVFRRADVDPQKVLKTVEQGMLKSLAEGRKQLALRMDPPDLGKVTVILQVGANKEVSAILRADSQESAVILNQQLSQLKQSLEQQGLKVEKLDVQTNVTQDQQHSAQWSGAGQHNQSQEQEARMAEQRAWGFLRRSARGGGLAQEMQDTEAGEVSSLSGDTPRALNIIA